MNEEASVESTDVESVVHLLAERELTLATVECGVDGVVSRRIFDAPNGPFVLSNSLVVEEVESAIKILGLPRPQLRKAGDFSAKAARAAAREGRSFLGANFCLAVWAPASITDWNTPQPIHIALGTGREVIGETFQYEGPKEQALGWVASRAIEMVLRALS